MESLLIDDGHGRAKKVVQLQVTEVKMPKTMRMIAYQGPFQHLIERALSDDRRAGKAEIVIAGPETVIRNAWAGGVMKSSREGSSVPAEALVLGHESGRQSDREAPAPDSLTTGGMR